MSLSVITSSVRQVLLGDGWHSVADQSFNIGEHLVHGGGYGEICSIGFRFKEVRYVDTAGTVHDIVQGPLTSILAVRAKEQE